MVASFTACVVFLNISGISWMYNLMCSNIVVIMAAMAIIAWRGHGVCWLFICVLSWYPVYSHSICNRVSAMSHPNSGILLFGTAFLPSQTFPICSFSYNWQTLSVMGIFFVSLWCTLIVCLWLSLTSTWFLPRSPIMQKSLYFAWNAFEVWSLTRTLSHFQFFWFFSCYSFLVSISGFSCLV